MRRSLIVLLFLLIPFFAAAGVVKGIVRDSTGEPLPFVVVAVKNSSYGVNTKLNGTYFLELKAGTYTLVFSQLGYLPQEHQVRVTDDKPVVLDVTMRSSSKVLATFEVKAKGDRDRGKEIMKQVIDHRDDYWKKVNNYKCNTYQKSSLEKVRIIKEGKDSAAVDATPPTNDTVTVVVKQTPDSVTVQRGEKNALDKVFKNKQLNLIESVSETYFKAPNVFKENILAYHDFAEKKSYDGRGPSKTVEYGEHEIAPEQYYSDNPYLLVSDAQSGDFNFYKNQIVAPALCTRPLLSPAAGTAFLNYRFELLDSFPQNGKTVYKLSVLPLFKEDALFSGLIFIEEGSWAIVSVNLSVNAGVLLYCKEFNVIEDFSEVTPGIYLPVRRQFTYTIREGKFNIIGDTRIELDAPAPVVVMMVGLQGSGKTTTSAKIAKRLSERQNKKVLMASLDTRRPAAQEQLRQLGEQVKVATLPIVAGQSPVDIAKRASQAARLGGYDVVILDTAGRTHIDEPLMAEMAEIRTVSAPHEILLVADSLTGQDAVNLLTLLLMGLVVRVDDMQ